MGFGASIISSFALKSMIWCCDGWPDVGDDGWRVITFESRQALLG